MIVWAASKVVEIDGVSTITLCGVFSTRDKALAWLRMQPDDACLIDDCEVDLLEPSAARKVDE